MTIYQIYMMIFMATYFGITLGLRSIILYKNTNVNTEKVFKEETGKKKSGKLILLAMFLMIVIAINFIWISQNYKFLIPISILEIGSLQTIGFGLSMLGQILGFIAQLQMKNSRRLGVDKNAEFDLVTTGLFKFSRNPIYLCLAISLLGFFLIAPNIISMICCPLMLYGINEKIKDEEEFLIEKFGTNFINYSTKVRRWI